MSASGCCSKWSARVASSSAIWGLSSVMIATAAAVVAANAAVSTAAAASCGLRSAVWISGARVSRLRCRPPARAPSGSEQPTAWRRCRGRVLDEHGEGVSISQIVKGVQGSREVLAQRGAQLIGVPGPGPDQVLVAAGEHLEGLGVGAVTSDRTVIVPVGADQIGEHFGVTRVGLRARHCAGPDSGPPPSG